MTRSVAGLVAMAVDGEIDRRWERAREAFAWRGGRLFARVTDDVARDRDRWPLWLPVAFASGIVLYFALPFEPPPGIGLALALGGATVAALGWWFGRAGRLGQGMVVAALAVAATAAGFAVARAHADRAAAPVLAKRLGPVPVTGRVVAVEPGHIGARLTLEDPDIARLAPERTPQRVRLRLLRQDGGDLAIGDRVRIMATLLPPPGPQAPGAYDFARDAWFWRIGAVGFAFGRPVVITRAAAAPRAANSIEGGSAADAGSGDGWIARFTGAIAEARRAIYAKVLAAVPGEAGPVTAALMTGDQGGIAPDIMTAMRDSGLAHLLSISGLHVALVTGVLFFGLRGLMALWPWLALNHPIKKWAAFIALIGIGIYTLLTGASVPTQRSFLMAGVVLIAVMVDRAAISMRLIAWAAVVVLLIAPESLLGPSFQMSFAAVGALIAAYEAARPALARLRGDGGVARRATLYVGGVLLTTLVAGFATAPFALYHFNRMALLGLAANLGAVPITSVWIMPWATLAYILAPFGLEQIALAPMGWGVAAVVWIAREVAAWPGAAAYLPALSDAAFAAIILGMLWLMLWRTRLRLLGLAPLALGIALAAAARPPDVLVAGDGRSFAVRDGARLVFVGDSPGRFERETWLRRAGLDPASAEAQPRLAPLNASLGPLACDASACLYRRAGQSVSLIREASAAFEDCARADVVVALTALPRGACRGRARLIGRFDLWREGAHALWLAPGGAVTVRTVAEIRGRRPWAPGRERR